MQYAEDVKFWVAVALTTFIKWLFTDEVAPEDETPIERRIRLRRALGGILAGFLAAYYGHEWIIGKIESLTEDDTVIVAIVLAITGEHIMRALMSISAETIRDFIVRKLGGK
ncbi:hypothetical protein GCM10016455_05400 [Aliiroseovarius zhejiangensis]|uniref:Holin n=1 Tax=Aliiroseovarius zhejiangensis TaxID=1632025 RepID=A0ABQ3IPB7_9RHOB|nr:hypothetical protein [Aliiroseovarius zhejiangensis]GHE88197.1 hypothetical protein GCM10016455_05400 [Aliiroseovarius zhejiangensis]